MKSACNMLIFLAVISLLVFETAFCQNNFIKSNYFSFYNPTVKREFDSRDNNVYEKMLHYGYRTGAQPTTYFVAYGLDAYKNDLRGDTTEAQFDQHITLAINAYKNFLVNYPNVFPPRSSRLETIYDKFFIPWNMNVTYCHLVDSLICYSGANKRNKAIEVVAKAVSATDTLFRNWYGCDTIIHQVAEEIQCNWRYGPYSFKRYTQGDEIAGYRLFFSVMNSIAGAVAQRVPSSSKTAIEWYYYRDPWVGQAFGDSTNTPAFRSEAFDSLINVNIFFMQTSGDDPEYNMIQSNAVADSISGNGRKLGVRYTWTCIYGDPPMYDPEPSASEQYKSLTDISNFFTNAKYLTIVGGIQLDGRINLYDAAGTLINVDASKHFKALSKWLDKDYLHIVDKFHEAYIDTAWWNSSGTITASGTDSMITLSSNSYIQSKVSFGKATTSAVIMRPSGSASDTQELGIHLVGSQWVKLYMKDDTAYTVIKVDGSSAVTTKHGAWGTISPGNKHEFRIMLDGFTAVFLIDGQYVNDDEFFLEPSSQLKIYSTAGACSLVVDSTSVIDPEAASVSIQLFNCGVDTAATYAQPHATFYCPVSARVRGILFRNGKFLRQFYDSGVYVSSGTQSTMVNSSDTIPAQFKICFVATNAAGSDTVYANAFNYIANGTILASAPELKAVPALPKTYSLEQNDPNPFNPSTTIHYAIPEGSEKVWVNLQVFNIRGQKVAELVTNEAQGPGSYSVVWDGSDSQGRPVTSGVYFYRLRAGDFSATRKMVIVK